MPAAEMTRQITQEDLDLKYVKWASEGFSLSPSSRIFIDTMRARPYLERYLLNPDELDFLIDRKANEYFEMGKRVLIEIFEKLFIRVEDNDEGQILGLIFHQINPLAVANKYHNNYYGFSKKYSLPEYGLDLSALSEKTDEEVSRNLTVLIESNPSAARAAAARASEMINGFDDWKRENGYSNLIVVREGSQDKLYAIISVIPQHKGGLSNGLL